MRQPLQNLIAFLLAGLASFAITAYGQTLWGLLVAVNLRVSPGIPWCAPLMAGLLVILLMFLGGGIGPTRSRAARARLLRWNAVSWPVFGWAVLAGALALGALGGLWLVTSDLIVIPAGVQPDVRGIPWYTVAVLLVMSSAAAPLSEEAAFRGYAQGMLEKAWGWAPAAVIGSSVLFALAHVTQGLSVPKLGLYFAAGLIFGTVAYLTRSLYAAMAVHSLGDVLGFTVLWPHDAQPHAHIGAGPVDPVFWPALIVLAVFLPLSLLAFRRVAAMRRLDARAVVHGRQGGFVGGGLGGDPGDEGLDLGQAALGLRMDHEVGEVDLGGLLQR
jgi:membrane protease YdiL (CAAX protease family)